MIEVEQLLAAIESQEPQALQALYDLYSRQVYSLAYAVTHSRELAEEVTQDVFLKVWHKVAQYEPGTNFKAWLLRVTRNLAIDCLRREHSDLAKTSVWDVEEMANPTNSLDDEARWVKSALSQLSEVQRRAIELAFLQGMTHQQIAETLNTPLGTIKTRIRDGLRKLRDVYEGEQ